MAIELSAEVVAIGTAIAIHGGAMIWKLSDLSRRAKITNARLERLEDKIFNGSHLGLDDD